MFGWNPRVPPATVALWVGAVVTCGASLSAMDAIAPGAFVVEPPTLHCLGFQWFVEGDDNGNARVAVQYREAGDGDVWRDGLPLLRVHGELVNADHEPFRTGNLFAGSVLGLTPDTEYEVHLDLTDPDGGAAERSLMLKTTPIPTTAPAERTLHVYPADFAGARESPSFATLAAAANTAQPGDHVLLHTGIHRGTYNLNVSGTAAQPIVFRSASDGEVILDGEGADGNLIDMQGGDHYLTFEELTFRNVRTAIKANDSNGLQVRRCHIEDVRWGIVTFTPTAGWYLADNTIVGRDSTWYPREKRESETGIIILGVGHVVCRNRIQRFWDCLAISNFGAPQAPSAPHTYAIDMYLNDLSEAVDDGLETDYGCHNVRVWENRILNCHAGLSTQPFYGGPCYLTRNVIYNVTNTGLKLHNHPAGLLIYHNTILTAGQGFGSDPIWQNATLRNNLLLGARRYALETGSPDPRTTLDYNGYRRTDDPVRFLKWHDGADWGRYATLAEFSAATGHEAHGVRVDYGDFEHAPPPVEGNTTPAADITLALTATSRARDAGEVLLTINEDYLGEAPDLGAYEFGAPLPSYGPLQSSPSLGQRFVRGDCDGDGEVPGSVGDALFLLQFLFLGSATPGCIAACDADGDGTVAATPTDPVYLLGFLFQGQSSPPPPFPECGRPPAPATELTLECKETPCAPQAARTAAAP